MASFFDDVVKELLSFVETADEEAFVAAMEADVVAVHEETLDAGPETLCNCCDGVQKSRVER